MTNPESTIDADIPAHPEEMKATYDLRVGKMISLKGSARITPAGVVTTGIALSLVALAFGFAIARSRRG
jgi:hypothetical protein